MRHSPVEGYRTVGETHCPSKTSALTTCLHGFITGKVSQDSKYCFSVFQPAVKLKIREVKYMKFSYVLGSYYQKLQSDEMRETLVRDKEQSNYITDRKLNFINS